jgi:hypothetical protein
MKPDSIYDWTPCNHSFRCLCRNCSWAKYNYDGEKPTPEERKECLKKLGRQFHLLVDERERRYCNNERKKELKAQRNPNYRRTSRTLRPLVMISVGTQTD